METFKVTIELPKVHTFSNKERGKLSQLPFDKLDPAMIARGAVFGLDTTVMNAYNSGGKSHKEKAAAMDKRIATLLSGEWTATERGEGIYTAYRNEVYLPLAVEQGMTLAAAEALIKAKVKEHFPPETKATFGNFLQATASERKGEFGGDAAKALLALEAWYDSELNRRREALAKAETKVVAPTIDLSAFKK